MIVVGVDGGGTRSRAAVMDDSGVILGTADGGPGIILPEDPMAAGHAVEAVVRKAARDAAVTLPLDALWAGLAGARRVEPTRVVVDHLTRAGLARRVAVGSDVEGAHADVFRGGPGVLLVLGTGSVVYAVAPDGRAVTVGGWGVHLGDEASGYRIGLDGLRQVVRGADGRQVVTGLTGILLEAVGLEDPQDLLDWTGTASKGEIAALSPLVIAAARQGDVVASRIVHEALGETRTMLTAVLEGTTGWEDRPGLGLVGGLLRGPDELRPPVRALAEEMGFALVEGPVVPERGAAYRARVLAQGG